MMNNEISIKDTIKVLTLFFVLALISMVLVYSKFEKEMDEAWNEEKKEETIFDNETFCQIIDLDNYEISGDVYEIGENPLVLSYIESGGETDVFGTLMSGYLKEE